MSQFTEADSSVNRLNAAVTAFEKVLTQPEGTVVEMPIGAAQPSLAERLKRAVDAVTVKPAQAAAQATASAQQAQAAQQSAAQSAADAANSAAATGYVDAPFPDVWAPLSDDLRLLAGSAPADTITVAGTSYPLPTKSMTFTRSTTATYIDKSGVLKTAAINEPRFEREGLLMEGQSTNYILNSDDPSKWENGTQLTKTVLAIDGQSQSVTGKFVVNSETTVSSMVRSTAINVAVGDTVTTSGRAKCSYGLIRVLFRIDTVTAALAYIDPNNPSYDNKSGPITITTQAIQDGYVYFTATLTAATAGNCDSYISANKAGSDAVIPVGAEYYLQMPQTEKNPVATSYIPTGAAAVTRAADNVILQASGNCGLRLTSDLIQRSVSFELTVNSCGLTSGTLDVLETYGAAYDKILRLSIAGSYALATYRSGTLTAISGSYPFYRKTVAHTLDGNAVAIYFDGKSNRRDAAPYSPTAAAQYLKISSNSAVVYHIRNLRIWHSVLSDIQIKGLR
ncbi:phage head spike fiber domain-containing protein [Leclercia adecarboxylata]|uniref:phage head spike fiber domain-containing protein n=1 Tax=Leclercia adecarboxylata TaxID=83655 RepID=UPI0012BB3740|nr:hypothetical protein [Leclercia adecarboxylata]QGP84370.1 hypothetical protein GLX29_14120 [Leclercia adecarboxylata]